MAATLSEIAKKANVSKGLVSRLLRDDPTLRVGEETRKRVREAVESLGGVRINRAARSLGSNLAYNFVMPINEAFSMEWFRENMGSTETFRAFKEKLKEKDFRLSLNMVSEGEEFDFLEDMVTSQGYCDGLFLEHGTVNKEFADYLLKNEFPHVCVDPRTEKFGINTVCEYGLSGLRQVMEHFLGLGHRRIGYIGTSFRYPVFMAAMSEVELQLAEEDRIDLATLPLGKNLSELRNIAAEEFAKRYAGNYGPSAYFCANDEIALGVMDVLRARGIEPGKDISIIGYDNIAEHKNSDKAAGLLTTIDVPFDEIGRRCGEVLLDQVLNKRKGIAHEHIPVKLIKRASAGPCRKKIVNV